jgi:hypothetical protein
MSQYLQRISFNYTHAPKEEPDSSNQGRASLVINSVLTYEFLLSAVESNNDVQGHEANTTTAAEQSSTSSEFEKIRQRRAVIASSIVGNLLEWCVKKDSHLALFHLLFMHSSILGISHKQHNLSDSASLLMLVVKRK